MGDGFRTRTEQRAAAACAAWPLPVATLADLASERDRVEREASRAAVAVATFVGVPAAIAAGSVLVLFALNVAVLLAPLIAIALTWVAWRANRNTSPRGGSADAPAPADGPPASP